ncbi:hypothetical protein BD310DRAFT_924686 [Dichomitus squalens]|uniref:Uncharacterized protein n=1 Tax=Dichomitus squalens TaxID=114155 RepID=A0A4Q9PY11_9APHY|nr:hypothetical protein BD310DRAFT_924686 [Dichomitus squalens]
MSHMSTVSLQTHAIVPVANCSVLQALLCSSNLPTSSVRPSYSTVTTWPPMPCETTDIMELQITHKFMVSGAPRLGL